MSEQQKTLLVYETTHGHTAKIAKRLAEAMRAAGNEVNVCTAESNPDPAAYDAIVVGASIHGGVHQSELDNWVADNREELAARPNAFFSVSLAAAEDSEEGREQTAEYINDFIRENRWTPDRCVPIAGALLYREYNPFLRLVMRLIMKRHGHTTDTDRDYDYTDWPAVENLGREFATLATEKREVAR